MKNAERWHEEKRCEWLDKTTIRMIREGEREAIRMEMAARVRRMGEEEVSKRITQSRYGRASWNGAKRKGIPWFEREGMMPIAPGTVRS